MFVSFVLDNLTTQFCSKKYYVMLLCRYQLFLLAFPAAAGPDINYARVSYRLVFH